MQVISTLNNIDNGLQQTRQLIKLGCTKWSPSQVGRPCRLRRRCIQWLCPSCIIQRLYKAMEITSCNALLGKWIFSVRDPPNSCHLNSLLRERLYTDRDILLGPVPPKKDPRFESPRECSIQLPENVQEGSLVRLLRVSNFLITISAGIIQRLTKHFMQYSICIQANC